MDESERHLLELSSNLIDRTFPIVDRLCQLLALGQISLSQWEATMRQEIEFAYVQQYTLGSGLLDGDRLDPERRDEILALLAALLLAQYAYLNLFASEIMEGLLSEAQIASRARLYIASSGQAFERGRAERLKWPELPAYRGDGTTICLTNCRCMWHGIRVGNVWHFYWILNPLADHCSSPLVDAEGRPMGCLERSIEWSPLIIS